MLRWGTWGALVIAALVLPLSCTPKHLDVGWLVRDRVELRPGKVPKRVTGPTHLVPDAVRWWNAQVGFEAFVSVTVDADVVVNIVPLGAAIQLADVTTVHYDKATGAVQSCLVELNADLAYHEATMRQALRHGLGHCLGLDDDPGIDRTVDLRSIMSDPLDPLGRLTLDDRERLRQEH